MYRFVRSEQAKHDLDLWYQLLRELWQYKQKHGHCRVPRSYKNRSLAYWVKNQRSKKRLPTPTLSQDQVDALNQMGFEWEVKPQYYGRVPPGGGSASAKNPSSHASPLSNQLAASTAKALATIHNAHTEPEIRKRPAHVLIEASSDPAHLPTAKKQRSRAPPTEESRVVNSSCGHGAFQSTSASASVVRLEPLPREIAAAEAKET
jgi:Helicase associated domain